MWQTEIGNFESFFPLLPPKNPKNQNFEKMKKFAGHILLYVCQKSWSYDVQFLRYRVRQTGFFFIWDNFYPFNPHPTPTPDNPWNQNFEKMKKTPGDFIILYMSTINDNHMMYVSWDMECNKHNFLSFWANFCSFMPLITWKIKLLKK